MTNPNKTLEAAALEARIKQMVERFLSWRLPGGFNPDGGISFVRDYNQNTPWPAKHEPSGTNLFDYTQAKAMVEHMLEGLPPSVSFDDWWSKDGSYIDPDTSDVPWFDKRRGLAEAAFNAALESLPLPLVEGEASELEAERLCRDRAMEQWSVSLKRPDLDERARVLGALDAFGRQALALRLLADLPSPPDTDSIRNGVIEEAIAEVESKGKVARRYVPEVVAALRSLRSGRSAP